MGKNTIVRKRPASEVVAVEDAAVVESVLDVVANIELETNGGNLEVAVPKISRAKKVVEGYGSPRGLYNLLEKLTPTQKDHVKEIGFGGLLELKARGFYHIMADSLIKYYNPDSRVFYVNDQMKCVITPLDVYDIFMIPCEEGNDVSQTSRKKKENPDVAIVERWRAKLLVESGEGVPLDFLFTEMVALTNGGDDFKRYFVLYAMGSFLAPTPHKKVDFSLVKAVENVDNIVKLDWCTYVLDQLGAAVRQWKQKNTFHVRGCLMLLQLVYFHRLSWRGKKEQTALPLVSHWTYEAIKKRIDEEYAGWQDTGKYGMGDWDNNIYPITKSILKVVPKRDLQCDDPRIIRIPDDLPTDVEIRNQYDDPYEVAWMLTKRDMEMVARFNVARLEELRRIEVADDDEAIVLSQVLTQGNNFSWTQELKKPDFLAAYESLAQKIDEAASIAVEMPSFDLNPFNPVPPRSGPPPETFVQRCTRLRTKRMGQVENKNGEGKAPKKKGGK